MKAKLNQMLFSLIGSSDLVVQWWKSPNKAFDMKTPNELWQTEEGQKKVTEYIYGQFGSW
jgi:uncharacterized protein (DUF2384 family)